MRSGVEVSDFRLSLMLTVATPDGETRRFRFRYAGVFYPDAKFTTQALEVLLGEWFRRERGSTAPG